MRATVRLTTPPISVRTASHALLPQSGPVGRLLQLQRTRGNRFVQRLVSRAGRAIVPDRAVPALTVAIEGVQHGGTALEEQVRMPMERAFGTDFGRVRVHDDAAAGRLSRALGAAAFTTGQHLFFGSGEYDPSSASGRRLLAHELTHVIQQAGAGPSDPRVSEPGDSAEREADRLGESVAEVLEDDHPAGAASGPGSVQRLSPRGTGSTIHRRLIVLGAQADIDSFIALVEPACGLELKHDAVTNQIAAIEERVDPATSPALRFTLATIMGNRTQHAEIYVGRGQPGVTIGQFPEPQDLSAGTIQRIDIDDITAIEARAPGSGVAALAHEINENYQAHSVPVVAGSSRFGTSHEEGVAIESLVLRDLVDPAANRVAEVTDIRGETNVTDAFDYESFILVLDWVVDPVTKDASISNARRAPRTVVGTYTIDNFETRSPVVPRAGAAKLGLVVADLRDNPTAMVTIEGFTDDAEAPDSSVDLGRRRAEHARDDITARSATVGSLRCYVVGRGATNFVVPNKAEGDRAQNRRVVMTVVKPGP